MWIKVSFSKSDLKIAAFGRYIVEVEIRWENTDEPKSNHQHGSTSGYAQSDFQRY